MKLFLVYGMSGSGKTTISKELSNYLFNKKVSSSIIPLDFFYKEKYESSFDTPNAFDWNRLIQTMNELKANKKVILHPYNYQTKVYDTDRSFTFFPTDIVIIEGLYANYCKFLLLDEPEVIKIDTPPDICICRRVLRDRKDRGINPVDNVKIWLNDVRPNWDKWSGHPNHTLEPTYIISGTSQLERYSLYENIFNSL